MSFDKKIDLTDGVEIIFFSNLNLGRGCVYGPWLASAKFAVGAIPH